jgi:nucleoside-diphosphate-sugar epimerase
MGLVSPGARGLAAQALGNDRVLVTGASGWLGRTALDLLAPLGLPTLALASRARRIRVGDREMMHAHYQTAGSHELDFSVGDSHRLTDVRVLLATTLVEKVECCDSIAVIHRAKGRREVPMSVYQSTGSR